MTEEDTLYRWTMNVSEISSISEEEKNLSLSVSLFLSPGKKGQEDLFKHRRQCLR